MMAGKVEVTVAAISSVHLVPYLPVKLAIPRGTVKFSGLFKTISGQRKSFKRKEMQISQQLLLQA